MGSRSTLKKFPEEMATRMAAFGAGGGQAGAGGGRPMGQGGRQQGRPMGGPPAGGGQGRPGGGAPGAGMGMRPGGSAGGVDDMFDRFPSITIADLKPGDMIAVSSTKGGDMTRITAIKLLSGVEPFVRAAGGRRYTPNETRTKWDYNSRIDGRFSINRHN